MEVLMKDEREDVQKKTFAKWINSQLAKGHHPPVTDLFFDLRDGTRLLALLEVLTGRTYRREKGRMRVHHLNNVSRALAVLEEHGVRLINISNEHIVDGSAKLTLGLVWAIILHWQVQGVLKDVLSDLQQTNLEKTLLAWCRQTTKGYYGVDIRNFTTCWADGLAFNALLHAHRPQLFEWTVVARKHPYARLENAFRIANEHLGIERLLDPEDVNSQTPDKKSIMMYVMCLFQALPHDSFTVENLDASLSPDASTTSSSATGLGVEASGLASPMGKGRPLSTASIGLGGYQRTLEEVLSWLLGAEDRLAAMPPIADTTNDVKDQFHDLEELMLDLTSKQGGIGDVLGEGSRLLREGVMEEEEEEEVRVQMKLLNTRWEELRVRAMDRQSRLHERLMSLQQRQLEGLKKWLTKTEDRIANMSQVGPTTEALKQQVEAHQQLQHDLEAEQSNINSLSNMVVVVDEASADSVYSTLEDELNALGERWAHICRWTESRWSTLQTLNAYWPRFEDDMGRLREWVDAKGKILRQFESEPVTEDSQVLRHASALQVLEAEMEAQQQRFDILQDTSAKILIHIPEDSPPHRTLPSQLEDLQDSFDLLTSMMEAQTTRLAASGIDIKKVRLPVEGGASSGGGGDGGGGEVVRSSTTTITSKDASTTLITKVITTKVTETVSGSSVKRQKMEGGSQEDFSVALRKLGEWMEGVEEKAQSGEIHQLSLQQLTLLLHQLEAEMAEQQEEYNQVVSLGQSAISETSTTRESDGGVAEMVEGVVERWQALSHMLEEIRCRMAFVTCRDEVTGTLTHLEKRREEVEQWREEEEEEERKRREAGGEGAAGGAGGGAWESKLEEVERCEEEAEGLRRKVEGLEERWTEEKQALVRKVEENYEGWRKLRERLRETTTTRATSERETAMEITTTTTIITAESAPQQPPEALLKAIVASREWLEGLGATLGSGGAPISQGLTEMEDRLARLKELQKKVESERSNMDHINSTCSTLVKEREVSGGMEGCEGLEADVGRLSDQWEATTRTLKERIEAIEGAIKKVRQYEEEVCGLQSWLGEVEVFLGAEEAALGDVETLEAQLEQSNALQDDITTLRTNMENITTAGTQLVEEARAEEAGGAGGGGGGGGGGGEFANTLRRRLDALTHRWETVTHMATLQNKSLKEALARSQKVHKDLQELNTWLDGVQGRLPPTPTTPTSTDTTDTSTVDASTTTTTIETPEQLTAAVTTFKTLREEVSVKADDLKALNKIGDEMLQTDSAATHEELARCLTQVNGRWTEVTTQVDYGHKRMSEAAQRYEEFRRLCGEEEVWLDQLEGMLQGSSRDAVDAEEISEALDALDLFLHTHEEGRLEVIRQLGEGLVGGGCVVGEVTRTTSTLTQRFTSLNAQARERQTGLEGRIQEAQAWEREYVGVLDHLSQADASLSQALTDGVMLLDLAVVEGELAEQVEVLERMRAQVEVYRGEGKGEAAGRLEDQVSHLQHKYKEVEGKLHLCHKPPDFDERLRTTETQLLEVRGGMAALTLTSPDPDAIQDQLTQCMALYQTLSDIKGEVEEVIARGRRIVKEGHCADPEDLTAHLDRVKALYNQLGGAVTEQRGVLERAVRQVRKLGKECAQLEEWLGGTEAELDQREAAIPTQNLQAEAHFVQHALEDLSRRRPQLVGLQEGLASLLQQQEEPPTPTTPTPTTAPTAPTTPTPLEERVGDLSHTWERVTTRLNNRLVNIQSEQAVKEVEMETFIVGLGEVKGWLESTEAQLATLPTLPTQDQERLVKAVSGEAQRYKGQIGDIRGTAEALVRHGVLFQARVTPELDEINDRWERIYTTLQRQEAMEEEMSVERTFVREKLTSTTSTISTTTTTTVASPLEEKDEVEDFLREVTRMSDKVTALTGRTQNPPPYQHAQARVEALEQEVGCLEPDVATVISHGDTLTLKTHSIDVQRAQNIRLAVNDLRAQWSTLKACTEGMKQEVSRVSVEVDAVSGQADAIIAWCNDVSKRLHLLNNDESQLAALEMEMAQRREELDALNESGALLRKYQYTQIQPVLTLLNMRWTEIAMQFRQYHKGSMEKKAFVEETTTTTTTTTSTTTTTTSTTTTTTSPPQLLATIGRVREGVSATTKKLSSRTLATPTPYSHLKAQEEELKRIKENLATLKPCVDAVEEEREAIGRGGGGGGGDEEAVRKAGDKLREEWAQVNRGYTDRHNRWLHCSETLTSLHHTLDDFSTWLTSAEEKVAASSTQPLTQIRLIQKELEKQVTLKHRPSQSLQTMCKEVVEGQEAEEGRRLQERVDGVLKRWRALLVELAARRERITGEEGGGGRGKEGGKKEAKEETTITIKESTTTTATVSTSSSAAAGKEGGGEVEGLAGWVEQVEALMAAPVNVTDEASLSAHSTMVQNHLSDLPAKQNQLTRVKAARVKGATQAQLVTLEAGLDKVSRTLPDYKRMVETKLGVIQTLGKEVEELYRWTEEVRVKVALRNLSEEEVRMLRGQVREREAQFEGLDSTYWVLAQDVEAKGLTVAVGLKNRISTIETRLKMLQAQMSEVTPAPPPLRAPHAEEGGVKGGAGGAAAPPVGSTVTPNVTSVIKDVMKLEECVLREGQEVRPPSPLVCPPRHPPDSSPVLILASLDKSILQIRDWLTLMEQMSRQQTVVVGDAEDIRRLTEKQKNVLRELEGKKPQLDELVSSADGLKEDASRTQLHQKVSKLREHWDETNSVVLARKTQLDAMYSDTHKFDAKRAELETWLGRMEGRLERMAPVARTADVLDQQIREQKGFHAEIHQYKHQLELFNQMTQRLIAIYQHDDTRRLKKITETINFRYSSLNASIIARGKELHSAINSLHNFDKALDKFAAWISEMESGSEILEGEVDKLGPPPVSTSSTAASSSARGHLPLHHPQRAGPTLHLKDLQSEIESHKDVLTSLNATGQKLLGTLENQEEAVMLQRRLEEMNHRWNTLKHKSIAIRNRLEGNSENWTTLLLSLRELIEWVIRKDTELTALGPLVGDPAALTKYTEDLASFRRVIEEKQPVIESNLKSGRQLIASEPPLSDTSDSEAGRELDGDARYRGDETARDLTRAVRREVAKLSEKWAALRERVAATTTHAELAHKKLGVLSKTVEEVNGRLEEAERVVEGWGASIPHDPNLADQHAHNVKKFREGLVDLQRGVDDVNDQAARFSAHSVPLTPANSARLHELNTRWKNLESSVNDRWRQVAGRSREVTPLTPAQLASSVAPPWERATTTNKVPYYINHEQESTHWDHPTMMDVLDSLTEFNHIKFSAYRTATKLRVLQKKLALDKAKMQTATDIFDEHGLRGQNDRLIDVGDMVVVLSALYGTIAADHPDIDTTLAMDLCLNWLLNVYDSQRTGQMRVLSFKIGLVCLCTGHLEEKYRYMFRLIADPNRLVDQRKLGLLLHDCVQVPRQLGEVAAFGGSNIEPSVRSCFTKAGKDRDTIEAVHFLAWVQQEPQSLVWLAVLHRVAASESIQHQVKCNICKAYPIVGLRYRCLKCLSFDMCQDCFFDGRSGKSHKITHPMHEYCTATTAGEDVKDFTKALKNKFKSKRSLQKHTKKGYLPVQTVLEGDPLESPSPSPQHNVTSQDMHSRLEMYASRLAEVELRTNSNSTPDSEDEHGLIAQYCQSLSSSDAPLPVPRSPLQIMAAVDADQKDELEQMIRALEEENSVLQAEYDRLKSQQPVGSPPEDGLGGPQRSEAEMLAEAKLLRQHKGRLEARMGILEEHNRQLEAQLHRLRQLLGESGLSSPNKSGTLQTKSVTASQLAMDSPAKVNGHSAQGGGGVGGVGSSGSPYDGLDQLSEYVRPPPPPLGSVAHVGNLLSRAAPYRSSGWRAGEGSWHSGGHNEPRAGERLA